jgi:hypothetical protein
MCFRYRKRKMVVSTTMQKEADTKAIPEVDICVVVTEDMAEGEVDPPHVLIAKRLVMYQGFVRNSVCFVNTAIVLNMSPKIVLTSRKSGRKKRPIATWCMQSHARIRRRMSRPMSG